MWAVEIMIDSTGMHRPGNRYLAGRNMIEREDLINKEKLLSEYLVDTQERAEKLYRQLIAREPSEGWQQISLVRYSDPRWGTPTRHSVMHTQKITRSN